MAGVLSRKFVLISPSHSASLAKNACPGAGKQDEGALGKEGYDLQGLLGPERLRTMESRRRGEADGYVKDEDAAKPVRRTGGV